MVSVPNNWANYFQPLDLTVNTSSKDFLPQETKSCHSQEIIKQNGLTKLRLIVRVCRSKTVTRDVDRKIYDYVKGKPQLIKNG